MTETERVTYCILKRFDEQGELPAKDYPFRTLDTELQLTAKDWMWVGIATVAGLLMLEIVIVGAVQNIRWLLTQGGHDDSSLD